MVRIRKLIFLTLMCVFTICSSTPVFAADDLKTVDQIMEEPDEDIATKDKFDIERKDDDITEMLTTLFDKGLYTNKAGLAAGMSLAQPVIYLTYIGCIALVLIVSYFFVGVTMVDLAYIIIPPIRGLLNKRKQSRGGMGGGTEDGGFIMISDSCMNAVHGSSGGSSGMGSGMGPSQGGSDRGVGSALVRYAGDRTKEFAVFILFVIFFLTGMLGRMVIILYRLFASLFNGIANLI